MLATVTDLSCWAPTPCFTPQQQAFGGSRAASVTLREGKGALQEGPGSSPASKPVGSQGWAQNTRQPEARSLPDGGGWEGGGRGA